jgi:hypothetical protein
MESRLPPVAPVYPTVAPIAPAGPGPGAKTVSSADAASGPGVPQVEPVQERAVASAPKLTADVRIEIDRAAVRLVQTFLDPETGEELNQFPYESQLAFSRAVVAFERAKGETEGKP